MTPNRAKDDAVLIRTSSGEQDEKPQIENVRNMLRDIPHNVPPDFWVVCVASRRKITLDPNFIRLMDAVRESRIGTLYIESQDRFGTTDRSELFGLLGELKSKGTRLFDLRARRDLTEKDLAGELLTVVNSFNSQAELEGIAFRSLRTKVSNFLKTGCWPTGCQPFGFGKACYTPNGQLEWVWQPVSRLIGHLYFPSPDSDILLAGPRNCRIPRNTRGNVIRLVPSDNDAFVRSVKSIFELYTKVGLSRRKISDQLNSAGHKFYDVPFSHSLVSQILSNPAYVGDTHFGKRRTGDYRTFDTDGQIIEVRDTQRAKTRCEAEQLVKRDTHDGLIDRSTWLLAQAKRKSEEVRTSFAPRNPAYYLKQLLVCGHCGKGMGCRTEINPSTGERNVVYVCSTYLKGQSSGLDVKCGYHRISHEEAEGLLKRRLRELGLRHKELASPVARLNCHARLAALKDADQAHYEASLKWIGHAAGQLIGYLESIGHVIDPKARQCLMFNTECLYDVFECPEGFFSNLPITLAELKQLLPRIEHKIVDDSRKDLVTLRQEHKNITLLWPKASAMQQEALKEETDRLEAEIAVLEERTTPLSARLKAFLDAEDVRDRERKALIEELPTLEYRERGEAFRRVFKTVTLYWQRTFRPARPTPSRPRRTSRPGRYSYTLDLKRIEWQQSDFNLDAAS